MPAAHGRGVAGQREDRAVVRRIGLHVEHAQAGHGAQRVGELVDDVRTTPFADIRNTFDDGHVLISLLHA